MLPLEQVGLMMQEILAQLVLSEDLPDSSLWPPAVPPRAIPAKRFP